MHVVQHSLKAAEVDTYDIYVLAAHVSRFLNTFEASMQATASGGVSVRGRARFGVADFISQGSVRLSLGANSLSSHWSLKIAGRERPSAQSRTPLASKTSD